MHIFCAFAAAVAFSSELFICAVIENDPFFRYIFELKLMRVNEKQLTNNILKYDQTPAAEQPALRILIEQQKKKSQDYADRLLKKPLNQIIPSFPVSDK